MFDLIWFEVNATYICKRPLSSWNAQQETIKARDKMSKHCE